MICRFETPSISKLIEASKGAQERITFSVAATEVCQGFQWSRTTAQKAFRIMCRVLQCTTVDASFTNTIKLLPVKRERSIILGNRYGNRSSDDPGRVMVESWIMIVKENTNCKSDLSIRNIMNFFFSACLPAFGLEVDTWPVDANEIVKAKFTQETITKICHGKNSGKKVSWLQFFLSHIVETDCMISKGFRKRLMIIGSRAGDDDQADQADDDTDHHRISSTDLDRMFLACSDTMPQKLMFMLMITTGLRISGLTNIRIARVAKLEGSKWVVSDSGRTICKGNKIYRFTLNGGVQELISIWLHNHRPADPSPFLFPGRDGGKISTSSVRWQFRVICRKAGLDGAKFHPHALRHICAHILLESGNSSSVVANLLKHASSATTEHIDQRESDEQLTDRANIPWLAENVKKRKREPVVPA
jgi:hypothetical protein